MAWGFLRESQNNGQWLKASWALTAAAIVGAAGIAATLRDDPFEVTDQRLTHALSTMEIDVEAALPGWRIDASTPSDEPAAAYTWPQQQRIEVFAQPNWDRDTLSRVLAHEIGHAIDIEHGSPELRRQWLELRAIDSTGWWPGDAAADFHTGAGDFAETFAFALVGNDDFRSEVGDVPTEAQIAFARSWID